MPTAATIQLWIKSGIVSAIIYVIWTSFLFLHTGSFSIFTVNNAFAGTGFILIGLSFALSSLCYFWNFADKTIIYRKYIGIWGFAMALTHGILSLFFIPAFPFPTYYFSEQNITSFTFALVSLIVYFVMAIISNQLAVKLLGGTRWRNILRAGYIAYFFTLLHFILKGYIEWLVWLASFYSLFPPPGLVLSLFGISILWMRYALWVDKLFKKKDEVKAINI